MDRGIFVASSTAGSLMDRQATVAQNLANVSTVGFKKIFDRMVTVPAKQEDEARLKDARSYAVELTPGVDARAGAMIATGNALDVSLLVNQYLTVAALGGGEAYTRRGNLLVDAEGVLRLPTGQALLGQDGSEIAIPAGFTGAIADDGTAWAQDPANAANKQEIGRLKIVEGREVSLRLDGFYSLGQQTVAADGVKVLSSGHLEQSNVSAADALAEMIETSRLYEMNTRLMGAFNTVDQKGSEILANWQ
jgi:flagellar basal-body rod protein FlgF